MARSLTDRFLRGTRLDDQTIRRTIPGTLRLWPVSGLVGLTLLVLILVYTIRPTVQIDLGSRYDVAFLRDFHAREVDAIEAGDVVAWPDDQQELILPGQRSGTWIAAVSAVDAQAAPALGEMALSINGQRVRIVQRRSQGLFLAIIPDSLAAAPEWHLRLEPALVNNPDPSPTLIGQVELAPARTYRWTRAESRVLLPGLGRGDWQVDLTALTHHPDGSPLHAQVFANGELLATLPDSSAAQRIRLLVPAALMRSGDLELTLRSETFEDPRPLGLFLAGVTVTPVHGSVGLLPPWKTLLYSLVSVLSVYICLALLLPRPPPDKSVWQWFSLILPLALIGLGGWALATYRFPTSFMLPNLATLGVWSLLLMLVLRPLLAWIWRKAALPFATEQQTVIATQRWSLTLQRSVYLDALLLIFFLGYWLKVGGMFYPYFVSIDVGWHMDKVRWILEGQLPLLYSTNSPLNELTMPTAEWGEAKPVIPYSPWFHMFATSFALLPWPMSFTANMFSALVDCSRVFLIALLALKGGMSRTAALFATLLYAVLPVTFLLHSWGNIPTTFGLWWTLAAMTFALVAWDRLRRPLPFAILTLLFLGSLLFYTVTGAFLGMTVVLFILILALIVRRPGHAQAARAAAGLFSFGLAAGAGLALALLIYYGQYIGPIVRTTLPYMADVFASGPESVGVARPSFGQYLMSYVPHLDYRMWPGDFLYYGLALPLLFVLPGFVALRRHVLLWSLLAAWLTVGLFFLLAGYRISMVDKQLFFILPAICICWGVYAERYWTRGYWGKLLIGLIYLFTLVSALDLWLVRIIRSPIL